MNYETSLFSRAYVRPCKIITKPLYFPEPMLDLAKSLRHLHSQLMNHKVYIKSYTVGILHTSLAQQTWKQC